METVEFWRKKHYARVVRALKTTWGKALLREVAHAIRDTDGIDAVDKVVLVRRVANRLDAFDGFDRPTFIEDALRYEYPAPSMVA